MDQKSILKIPQIAKAQTYLAKAHNLVKLDSNYNDVLLILDEFTKYMEEIAEYGHETKSQEAFMIIRKYLPYFRDLVNQARFRNIQYSKQKKDDQFAAGSSNSEESFDDLYGKDEQINQVIYEAIKQIRTMYKVSNSNDTRANRTILLMGAPYNGKNFLSKAIAFEFGCKQYHIELGKLLNKFPSEAQNQLSLIFNKARENRPSTIVIDVIDAIASDNRNNIQEKLFTQLMYELDHDDNNGILNIHITNRPFDLSQTILRRYTLKCFIPKPDERCRRDYINSLLKTIDHNFNENDIEQIVNHTQDMSFSNLFSLWAETMIAPMREMYQSLNFRFFYKEKNELPVYIACDKGEPDSIRTDLVNIKRGLQLQGILITAKQMNNALCSQYSHLDGSDEEPKYVEWAQNNL